MKKLLQFFASVCLLSVISLAQSNGTVTITSPLSGSTAASPVHFIASAQAASGRHITAMRIYVDYVSVYTVFASSLNTYVSLAQGSHRVIVQALGQCRICVQKVGVGKCHNAISVAHANSNAQSKSNSHTGSNSNPDPKSHTDPKSPTPTATSCSGTTYYVSTSGNDSNNGVSTTSPWKSVAKVVAFEPSLRQGDCVLFQRGGVWNEQLSISNVHGSQSYPITFGNYGSGNPPVLDGGSTRLYGIVGASASGQAANSYVTIDGFEVRNATSGGIIFSYSCPAGYYHPKQLCPQQRLRCLSWRLLRMFRC